MIGTIVLDEPIVHGTTVRFGWSVTPATTLALETSIELHFPDGTDVESVPRGLLWIAALAMLHPLWILLRPCIVRLPIALPPEEAEVWQRLLDSEIATLEAYRDTGFRERCIFFAFDGERMPEPVPFSESLGAAAAFSGGKDSLLQAALLVELGMTPALVATTSPLPPLHDHLTARRAFVLKEAASRLGAPLIEVHSNARGLWNNGFAARRGYPLAVSEMTDTHLYFASLLIAGAARGATHLFLASEADVQTSTIRNGRFVQILHFMYSVATQATISALLEPWNVRYTSLTSPLCNAQVQRLLWSRYPSVAELQYSCWHVRDGQSACSDCNQCLRMVLGILAVSRDPRDAGFDPDRAIARAASWFPKTVDVHADTLPESIGRANLSAQMIATVRSIDPRIARTFLDDGAFAAFEAFKTRLAREPVPHVGMRPSFAEYLDPAVCKSALAVYRQAFPDAVADDDRATAARTRGEIDHITEPLSR